MFDAHRRDIHIKGRGYNHFVFLILQPQIFIKLFCLQITGVPHISLYQVTSRLLETLVHHGTIQIVGQAVVVSSKNVVTNTNRAGVVSKPVVKILPRRFFIPDPIMRENESCFNSPGPPHFIYVNGSQTIIHHFHAVEAPSTCSFSLIDLTIYSTVPKNKVQTKYTINVIPKEAKPIQISDIDKSFRILDHVMNNSWEDGFARVIDAIKADEAEAKASGGEDALERGTFKSKEISKETGNVIIEVS